MTAFSRALTALALTVPATGALLLAAPSPASAAVVSPGNGTVYEQVATVQIRADYPASGSSHTLSVAQPDGGSTVVATAPADRFNGGTMTYGLDLGCWTNACRPAPNGTWTITQSGGQSASSSFVVRVAPKAPTGVRAEAVGDREVRVSWEPGSEPDLRGYEVLEGGGVVGETGASCDGGTCSTTVGYASPGSGTHTYVVRALRSDGRGGSLTSPTSSSASATLEAAPEPEPEPTSGGGSDGGTGGGTGGTGGGSTGGGTGGGSTGGGSTGGGTGGGTGGSTGGSGTPSGAPAAPGAPRPSAAPTTQAQADSLAVAQRKAFATGFTSFGPKLGIPKLPPLPQAPSVAAPEIADGSFEPTLGFTDQVVQEQVEVASGPSRVRNVVSSAIDSEQLARSTAGALVLLLAGAHLRRWLGSHTEP